MKRKRNAKKDKDDIHSDIFIFHNPDKVGHHVEKDPLLPYFPSVVILAGLKNSGKGTMALNILVRMNPRPTRVIIVHPFLGQTSEWDFLTEAEKVPFDDIEKLIGDDEYFKKPADDSDDEDNVVKPQKIVLIIDELRWDFMPHKQKSAVEALVNFGSTHHNILVILLQQNFINIPISIRRNADWWTLWNTHDRYAANHVKNSTGINIHDIFEDYCPETHDSVTINRSCHGPKIRAPTPFLPLTDEEVKKYTQCKHVGRKRKF